MSEGTARELAEELGRIYRKGELDFIRERYPHMFSTCAAWDEMPEKVRAITAAGAAAVARHLTEAGALAPAGLTKEQAMGKTELFHTDGVDDRGQSMADVLTVRMTRAQWWLARNQLRNMEDDWRRTKDEAMAARCADVADVIDDVLHDAADAATGAPS